MSIQQNKTPKNIKFLSRHMTNFGIPLVSPCHSFVLKTILKTGWVLKIISEELLYWGQIYKSSQGDQSKLRDPSG